MAQKMWQTRTYKVQFSWATFYYLGRALLTRLAGRSLSSCIDIYCSHWSDTSESPSASCQWSWKFVWSAENQSSLRTVGYGSYETKSIGSKYSGCGHAIAQAASRRVRAQVRSCGICDGQTGTGVGILRVLRVPLTAPHSSSFIIRGWHIDQLVVDIPIGIDDPTCERCLEEVESVTHILCYCEAISYLRFRHMGQLFMEGP
jgi:hypothetical protein